MGWFRRTALPVALAVVTVGAAITAVTLDRDDNTDTTGTDTDTTVTPVLSARRLPEHVTTPGADLTLRLRLIELLSSAPPDSCLVVQVGGREILTHQGDLSVIPASGHKTLLAAAILDTLGPDHRFTTEIRGGAVDGNGVVRGDAWLVGAGDPQLSTTNYGTASERQGVARTALEDLADEIADAGITRITGRLVADETRYDSARAVATWRPDDSATASGPLSALSVNDSFASFPTMADPAAPRRPSPDPPRSAAITLAFLLAARGVTVDGGIDVGAAAPEATVLASVDSAPLSEIVGEMLTYSDNQTAELLLKELGVEVGGSGTTADGATATAEVLADAGIDITGATFVDGSGLSDTNRVTCDLLAAVLEDDGAESPLAEGLAVAGESGTLAASFRDTPAEGRLRAKTGSLNDVIALAGFVTTAGADDIVFSLVINRPPFIQPEDVELRDSVALVLADYPQRPSLDEVGPRPAER